MRSERTGPVVRLLTAFVIGFVTLTLEIAYTRVVSFKLFYYYTYFVIGLALLGLGAASAVTALSTRLRSIDPLRLTRTVAPVAALAGLVGYGVVARLPTDVNLIWTGTAGDALGQLVRLLVLSLSLTAVFFGAGLLLAGLIVAEVRNVRRLYFWDLTGAALGCLLAVPLQATIGPPAMIMTSLVVLAGLGAVAAAAGGRPLVVPVVATAVTAVVALGAVQLNVRVDDAKSIRDGDTIAAGDWGAVFRVDAVEYGDLHFLHHDGLWGSAIWRYDGTPATTDRFGNDSRQLPFAAVPSEEPRVLVIGAAGGNEVQAALTYGAGHIDAVELNPVTVDLLRGEFADYSGNLTTNPKVNYVQGDGRTYLARSDEEWDLIWFVAPDSYAATNAATAGAFVLSESYLYTKQMVETAYDRLAADGVVVAQFGDFDFDTRPTRTARYLVTARAALDVEPFADHAALVVERNDVNVGRASTIMLFRSPVDEATVGRLRTSLTNVPNAQALYLPGAAREDGITSDVIDAPADELRRVVGDYPYDISAVDDGKPFFWHFTHFSDVITDWERRYEGAEIAIGERLLVVMIGLGSVIAAVLLWLPFAATRRRGVATVAVRGRWRFFVYFASLGLGFMLVEISMIQRFALLLGFPTLSLSVSLFTLLVATAVGARVSGAVRRLPGGMATVTVALGAIAVGYIWSSEALTAAALSWPQAARIVAVFTLLFPIGLLLGTFLPAGMDAAVDAAGDAGADEGRLVAWCWAVNGFFSVLGASLTTVVSMAYGFDRAVLCGLVLYVVATLVLRSPTAEVVSDEEHRVIPDAVRV